MHGGPPKYVGRDARTCRWWGGIGGAWNRRKVAASARFLCPARRGGSVLKDVIDEWAQQEFFSERTLVTHPSILVLQLKRFQMHSGQVEKLRHSIATTFPYRYKYDITAVSFHYGRTHHSGHYRILCNSPEGGRCRTNDGKIPQPAVRIGWTERAATSARQPRELASRVAVHGGESRKSRASAPSPSNIVASKAFNCVFLGGHDREVKSRSGLRESRPVLQSSELPKLPTPPKNPQNAKHSTSGCMVLYVAARARLLESLHSSALSGLQILHKIPKSNMQTLRALRALNL